MLDDDKLMRWQEAVRRAVGFIDTEDLRTARAQHPQHKLDANGNKLEAHRSYAPFQIILRCTAKAIQHEDGCGRLLHRMLYDLQRFVSLPHADVSDCDSLGVQPWINLYSPPQGEGPQVRELRRAMRHERQQMEPRWVVGIEYVTNDPEQATERLNVFDQHAQVGERVDAEHWKPAKPGWNKRNNSIVLLLDAKTMLERECGRRHAFRFGPMLTAFLAACAPKAPNRFLVMKWIVNELMLFDAEPEVHKTTRQQEAFREWYAFHTLRRIYRMRWGVGLDKEPESAGPLCSIKITKDKAYQYYKAGAARALRQL